MTLIFNGDLETGNFSQYEGVFQAVSGRASIVTSPVFQGTKACRIEVRNGEYVGGDGASNPKRNRTELTLAPPRYNPQEGSDWWHKWSFRIPASTPIGSGAAFMQHGNTIPGTVELTGLFVYATDGHLEYQDNKSTTPAYEIFWRSANVITRDVWHTILLHKKYSVDPQVGFIEIWFDGAQQQLFTNASGARGTRAYQRNLNPTRTSVRMHTGAYRNELTGNEGTFVYYIDGLRIGTTRADVDSGVTPPPAPPPPTPTKTVIWTGQGGTLYNESGVLKWAGSGGTVTTLAPR